MRDLLVLTINGADRTGLVESLAEQIAGAGGNWEESRMARLAGEFAGILLVTIDHSRRAELVAAVRRLEATGLHVTMRTSAPPPATIAGAHVRLEVTGNDRPGIVRDVSRILAEGGVNVEELETSVTSAPMSGDPMFTARIRLLAPTDFALAGLRTRLEALAGELMVDIAVE